MLIFLSLIMHRRNSSFRWNTPAAITTYMGWIAEVGRNQPVVIEGRPLAEGRC